MYFNYPFALRDVSSSELKSSGVKRNVAYDRKEVKVVTFTSTNTQRHRVCRPSSSGIIKPIKHFHISFSLDKIINKHAF